MVQEHLDQLARAGGILSLCGSTCIVVSYLRSENVSLHQFCLFCLSVSDMFGSLALSFGQRPIGTGWCTVQASLLQFSLSAPFWTCNSFLSSVFLFFF